MSPKSYRTFGQSLQKRSGAGMAGWIGIFIDGVEWPMIADLVESSYRLIAPKRLVKALDELQDRSA